MFDSKLIPRSFGVVGTSFFLIIIIISSFGNLKLNNIRISLLFKFKD